MGCFAIRTRLAVLEVMLVVILLDGVVCPRPGSLPPPKNKVHPHLRHIGGESLMPVSLSPYPRRAFAPNLILLTTLMFAEPNIYRQDLALLSYDPIKLHTLATQIPPPEGDGYTSSKMSLPATTGDEDSLDVTMSFYKDANYVMDKEYKMDGKYADVFNLTLFFVSNDQPAKAAEKMGIHYGEHLKLVHTFSDDAEFGYFLLDNALKKVEKHFKWIYNGTHKLVDIKSKFDKSMNKALEHLLPENLPKLCSDRLKREFQASISESTEKLQNGKVVKLSISGKEVNVLMAGIDFFSFGTRFYKTTTDVMEARGADVCMVNRTNDSDNSVTVFILGGKHYNTPERQNTKTDELLAILEEKTNHQLHLRFNELTVPRKEWTEIETAIKEITNP
eukprot:GHVS01016227.1.p1 GENE.GHVS01016227.1~~GHVS01016227.1.p1  ORF type:complete len:390 (-),score=40.16 GHVS01016227.1:370-1539(-)